MMGSRLRFFPAIVLLGLIMAFRADVVLGNVESQSFSYRLEVLKQARDILENSSISYVYGGNRFGTESDCNTCNKCLEEKNPSPRKRFAACASCRRCSLDCSHFAHLVYQRAGLTMPYLDTKTMLRSSDEHLESNYGLEFVGNTPEIAQPGDLLVYRGHVVLLEKNHGDGTGDIIHATGSRDINGSGQGIQRARFIPLGSFRGPLQRILRHHKMIYEAWREDGGDENSDGMKAVGLESSRISRWVPDDLEQQ